MSERVITVKGVGSASVPPDWIKIYMSLKSKNLNYEKTLNLAAKYLEELRKSVQEHGFDKKDIKTTNFDINTSYERVEYTNGSHERVFKGYVCSQELYVGFKSDSKKLGNILASLSECKSKPEFSIKYELKDKKSLKEELLKNAVADATEKAKVIVDATGLQLGEIIKIDYNWSELRFIREDFSLMESVCESSEMLDIEPDDIEANDTVSIIWKIK